MLITFKSKASAEVLMYEEHAKPILDLLHKDIKRGVITAAETANAIALLEAAILESKKLHEMNKLPDDDDFDHRDDRYDSDEDVRAKAAKAVSFSARSYPLLEMLRAARDGEKDILWGV